jgi:outer membrane protein OmpA-like peptidoglycan-associated protein
MATDWAADVKKYAAKADDAIIAGIVRYCGIALQKVDSSLVAFSDPKELNRVRNNFLKKKLGRTEADSVLDAAIAKVGQAMKADRTKNRVTVYYLLADHYGSLATFAPKAKAAAAKAPAKAEKKPAAKTAVKAAGAATLAAGATAASSKKPAVKKAAAPKAAVKAPAEKVAAPAKVTTSKTTPTKKSVNPAKAAVATAAVGGALGLASAVPAAAKATAAKAADAVADTAKAAASVTSDAAKAAVGAAGDAGAAVVGAAGAAAAGAAALASGAAGKAASAVSGGTQALTGSGSKNEDSGLGWLWWLLGLAALLFLAWWLFGRGPADDSATPVAAATEAASSEAAGAGAELAAAPVEGSVTIPTGAGVTTETRDAKPVVKVYFDSGKVDIVPAFDPAAGGLKAWLDANPGSSLAISGYADPSGNAARNAELAKQRAQAVQAALVKAGIPEASAVLVKPDSASDANVAKDAARRVEVVVK